jgi:SAM-dependent methyltransferase
MQNTPMTEPRDHVARNRAAWEHMSDAYQEQHGVLLEQADGRAWGVWRIPESELRVLGDVQGLDVLELGCGAARWSISLARLGAKPVALDISHRQLEHARLGMKRAGVTFPLIQANAEDVPLSSKTFHTIFCDHGAFSVADPGRVMSQCARLLRKDGLLAFCKASPIIDLVRDVNDPELGRVLHNGYFDLHRVEHDGLIEFRLTYGEWIRLLRANDFEVVDLIEIRPPVDATTTFGMVPLEWARRWPAETIWKARRR